MSARPLQTGDIITSTASPPTSGFFFHKGIVVVGDDGIPLIYHNTPSFTNEYGGTIIAETLEDYTKVGRQMISVEKSGLTKEEILKEHRYLRHKRFHWKYFNCETYVSSIVDGDGKSKQIVQWGACIGAGIGIALFLNAVFSKSKH